MAQDGNAIDRLAVYGSLAPGESNHWVISRISGEWTTGTVRGYEFDITWGPADGYQGFIPDADGNDVAVSVLVSNDLERHWREIDEFEGPGYERRMIAVSSPSALPVQAHIYVALTDS